MFTPKILLVGIGCLALLSGCAQPASRDVAPSGDTASRSPAPAPTTTPAPIPTPSAAPTREPTVNPLTGLPLIQVPQPAQFAGMPPVLAVKIDNTRNAQPQAGVDMADLVYIEEVEYGMTRLAAIFSSTIPNRVGPVRSARITDVDLLAQYGSPAFAFSGAQRKLWPALADASFIDVSANKVPQDYSRDSARRAPYNYFFDAKTALTRVKDVSSAKDIGFTFTREIPSGGRPAVSAELTWPSSTLAFTYNPIRNQYAVLLNGERANVEKRAGSERRVWADTAVIQRVQQTQSVYFDKGGGNTPHAKTIGKGAALILRNGQLFDARWFRPNAQSGTTFTDAAGNPVPFHPGHTWIALYSKDREVQIKVAEASPAP